MDSSYGNDGDSSYSLLGIWDKQNIDNNKWLNIRPEYVNAKINGWSSCI